MGDVIQFRRRPIQPITIELVNIRDLLNVTMSEPNCTWCTGRGWIFAQDHQGVSVAPCPCGGDDENRIECDGPDYPGAA